MVKIECDRCERTFEVGQDEADGAGGRVSCPHCGDVNRVPVSDDTRDSAGQTRTGPRGVILPPDHGPEQEILRIHPAMLRAHPFRGLALTALAVGGLAMVVLPATSETVWRWIVWPGLIMMAAAGVWWLAWFVSAYLWVRLEITNKRTVRYEGIIRRNTSEVMHDHVRNVAIRQGFVQRILNVGYLGISSSGQDGIEIEVRDLPRPYELKAVIDEYRDM
jgi:hypothetical protein